VSLPQERSTAEQVFYTGVAQSRSGSSSFTAFALNKLLLHLPGLLWLKFGFFLAYERACSLLHVGYHGNALPGIKATILPASIYGTNTALP